MYFSGVSVLAVSLQIWLAARAAPPPAVSGSDSSSLRLLGSELNLTNPLDFPLSNRSTTLNASNRNFEDPYELVVGENLLTIELYGYRGTVTFADMDNCIRAANADILQHISSGRAYTAMGRGPFVWSSGHVALHLYPSKQMTWTMWILAPVTLGFFITENGSKGTQFILLWHEIGPVGYGQFR